MSSHILREILDILEQEARIYGSILKLSRDKTGIIVEGRVSELENMVRLEQTFIMQLGRLEAIRSGLIGKLADELGLNSSDITISDLKGKIDDTQADGLQKCQLKMTGIINELKNVNELNSKLIKNSLEFIDFSINMLTNTDNIGNNYGSAGMTGPSKKRSILDLKL